MFHIPLAEGTISSMKHMTPTDITFGIHQLEKYANDEVVNAYPPLSMSKTTKSAGPRHSTESTSIPLFQQLGYQYDVLHFAEQKESLTLPVVKHILAISQQVHYRREVDFMSTPLFWSVKNIRKRRYEKEGEIGGMLWGSVDHEIWDFHHEYEDDHHEWVWARYDKADKTNVLQVVRYVIEDQADRIWIRKVITDHQGTIKTTYLQPRDNPHDANELATLHHVAEQYYVQTGSAIYDNK